MYFLYIFALIPSWLLYKGFYGLFHLQAYVRPCGYRRLCPASGSELKILSLLFLGAGLFLFYKMVNGAITVELGKAKNKDQTLRTHVYVKHIIIGLISMLIILPLIIFLNIDGVW